MKNDDGILDGNFLRTIQRLDMSSGSSGLLSVNWNEWHNKVVDAERRKQLGCLAFIIVGIGYLYLPIGHETKFPMLMACFFLGVLYSAVQARIHRNLKEHGRYRYEVFPNKIVRFSDRDFQVIEFKDVTKASLKYHGLVLERKSRWANNWLKHGNPEIMVLPASLASYSAVAEYVSVRVTTESRG